MFNLFNVNMFNKWTSLKLEEQLKRQCHEIFRLFFFSLIQPIWVLDKQSNLISLKNSFSRRYSRKT